MSHMAGNMNQKVRRKNASSKATLRSGAGLPLNRLRTPSQVFPIRLPKEITRMANMMCCAVRAP